MMQRVRLSVCLSYLMHGRICGPIRTKLCTVTQGAHLTDIGEVHMWNHPRGVGVKIKKRLLQKLQLWNYFIFYVIVKIIIMHTHLSLDVYSNFKYFLSY